MADKQNYYQATKKFFVFNVCGQNTEIFSTICSNYLICSNQTIIHEDIAPTPAPVVGLCVCSKITLPQLV